MELKEFKEGLLQNTILTDNLLSIIGDENLEKLIPTMDRYIKDNKTERGYATVGLLIGIQLEGLDATDSMKFMKEAMLNSKSYIDETGKVDETKVDWLIQKTKLGI